MCGIAAIFAYGDTGATVNRNEMHGILERMKRRGPDGSGEWYSLNSRVGLGHRRLSIIDLSENGAQPMVSEDGKVVISFNGEIYNYKELRQELEQKGRRFRSQSDTEVLLHLYREHGEAMMDKLRGMYAFVIWDDHKRGLLLARDPFGIKPLYYAEDGKTFRAASQVKAILAANAMTFSPEPAGHVGYFLWGSVPAPYTLYHEIRALPAGHFLWVDESGPRKIKSFCILADVLAEAEAAAPAIRPGDIREYLHHHLYDSVRHHLIADVPVGVFLSAGLDSTTITALAGEAGGTLRTVTLGFDEFRNTNRDESHLAAQVAARLGARHQTIWVTQDDFHQDFARLIDAMDQPTSDGVNSFFISRAAAAAGLKVALSGLGGDELFGGYPSFKELPLVVKSLASFRRLPALGRGFRCVSAGLLRRFTSPKYASLLEYGGSYGGAYLLRRGMFMPWELPQLLDAEMVREGWQELQTISRLEGTVSHLASPHLKVSALEMSWYLRHQLLRDTDWASMDYSLEIRTPLVDLTLLRALAPLFAKPNHPDKLMMASAPRRQLPEEILRRSKTGFSVPVREWLLQEGGVYKQERGLRGWTKHVYQLFLGDARAGVAPAATRPKPRVPAGSRGAPVIDQGQRDLLLAPPTRICVLVTDAFGGHGGIAKFNRDLLNAVCSYPKPTEVVALPRLIEHRVESLPPKLNFVTKAANSKARYAFHVLKALGTNPQLIICGHIHLLPIAYYCHLRTAAPLVLIIHGVDAWKPTRRFLSNRLTQRISYFVAVSEVTKERFLSWTSLPKERGFVLPNCVDSSRFGSGPKKPELLERYGLKNKTVIMTLGRLDPEERYKGFDEILELLPELARNIPEIAYLIVGGGPDRPRLESKAASLGVQDRVVFAGRISEEEKADHYRLADAYVMPGSGEGFGIVYLEAMACGIPVVASKLDGSREALRNGELGILVDPQNPAELKGGILAALRKPKGIVPPGLAYFSYENFQRRCHEIMEVILNHHR